MILGFDKKLLSCGLSFVLLTALSCTKKQTNALPKEEQSVASATAPAKIFRHFRTAEFKTLDPMKQFDEASAEIISNVYDTLLQYHYLERPYKLVPNLLETMPEKQADGLTYLFKLKKGTKFNDDPAFPNGKGRELTIDDVIYSMKRFADANVNVLSYVLLQGNIEGYDQFREETRKLGANVNYDKLDISGVKKVDQYTMTVKLTRPNPLAFYPFAFSGTSIVAREAVEKYGQEFEQHPVGSGPFYIKQMSRRGELILAKNQQYHQTYPQSGEAGDAEKGLLADQGKPLPLIDEVRLPLIEETQPAMLKFLKGELDWIAMNKDDFNRMATRDEKGNFKLTGDYAEKYKIYTELGLSAAYFIINMNDKLLGQNKALRQAIAYALDTAQWLELLRNGRGAVLNTIVPHPIAGSERDIQFEYYRKNLEMVKKKLAEAGFPDGKGLPEIQMEFGATSKDVRQDFEFVRNELAAVGIKLKGNFQTFSAYLKKKESGNFQMASAGWVADYPDAENFYQLLYCKNKTPGPNDSNFCDPEYDKLYETIKFMENGPERYAHFRRMSEIIKENVPLILRWNALAFGLYQKRVINMKRNMMVGDSYQYLNIK